MGLLASALLAINARPAIDSIQARTGDAIWRAGAQRTDERRLVIIDIDEKSLQQIGPWPWPRATVAQLINQLAAQGVRQQILDIVFTDPKPDDAALLAAVRTHHPVLAQVFALPTSQQENSTAPNRPPQAGQPTGALPWPGCPAPFVQANGYLANQAKLAALGSPPLGHTGHISPAPESDGVVRRQPAIVCHNNQAHPALGIAALMQATGETTFTPQPGGLWDAPWSLVGQQQVLPRLPLDAQGNLRIGWHHHPDSYISISAADVLAGSAPPQLLNGAWALVGSSAFGLNDTIATPFASAASGMVAHAQIITTWLDGRTPYTPRAATALQAAATLISLVFLVWLAHPVKAKIVANNAIESSATGQISTKPLLLPLAGLACAVAMVLAHAMLLLQAAVWVGWVVPAMAVLLCSLALASTEHLRSRLERNRLYQHLTSYLPEPVAASLALQPPSSAIRASARQVSVLFADIRNFSAYCEARPPQESAAVLHAFFSAATQVVQRHGGVIEAFQGDAILAVWNGADTPHTPADNADPTHAAQALAAAIELLQASRRLLPDPAPAGLEPLQLGLGLETGPATAGSFGLASRRTHLVMGRTVTIANRLVNMTADLAHPILVGEGLATQIGGHMNPTPLQSLGTFLLDGLRVPHHVYAVPYHALGHATTAAAAATTQA